MHPRTKVKIRQTKRHIQRNWKLYGLTLGNVTLVPCYYDLKRFTSKATKRARKETHSLRLNFSPTQAFYNFFIPSYDKPRERNRLNKFGDLIADKVSNVKIWDN